MDVLNQFAASSYTGTGSAITNTIGFKPDIVVLTNNTDGDAAAIHVRGMADASHIQLTTAPSKVTSNGVTLSDRGFTVGTDAVINESGDVFKYFAIANLGNQVVASSFTGTGAAQTVTVGFKPKIVIAFNNTDGDTLWWHIQGMTDATAGAFTTATAAVSSQGCTLTDSGFTLGTSAVINENTKVFNYIAIGGGVSNQETSGTYTGNGTAQSVSLGYTPLFMATYNQTDGDSIAFWIRGMDNGTGYKLTTDALAVTNGFTPTEKGFNVGTDVTVNESAKVFVYCAI